MKTNLFCIVKQSMIDNEMVPYYVTYNGEYNLTEHFKNKNVKIEEFSNMLSLYEELSKIKKFEDCKIVQVTLNEIDVTNIQKNIEKLRNKEVEVRQQLDEIRTSIKTIYRSPTSINDLKLDKLDDEVLVNITSEMCDTANSIINNTNNLNATINTEKTLFDYQRLVIDHIKSLITDKDSVKFYYNVKYFVSNDTSEVKPITNALPSENGQVITVTYEMISTIKLELLK